MSAEHEPVLLAEVIAAFRELGPKATVVDATFGRGGHTSALLAALGEGGRVIALDWDEQAVAVAQAMTARDARLSVHHAAFAGITAIVSEQLPNGALVDGVLADLGVASPHFDDAERGFAIAHDGPLDMRMDRRRPLTAAIFVRDASEQELADCFYQLGDERFSRRIAAAIVRERAITPITRTRQLAEFVAAAHPRWPPHHHPATRVFQALRIRVNEEFAQLDALLAQLPRVLRTGGRAAVISFHSGEDRRVKAAFRGAPASQDPRVARLPVTVVTARPLLRQLGRAQRPSAAECASNPRARSATLRVAERLA